MKKLNPLALAISAMLTLCSTLASAEQTIGIQPAGVAAVATARVNLRVIVPKVIVLRVGDANATISDVTLTVTPSPAVGGAPGNSLAYSGATPPGFAVTAATTNPTTAAGALTVGAWTNHSAGGTLTCALTALGGSTAFAVGGTAAGVPGTNDISVVSGGGATDLQHPGAATLSGCNGILNTPITSLTVMGGTFTYGLTATLASLAAGSYGNIVTYTATTP